MRRSAAKSDAKQATVNEYAIRAAWRVSRLDNCFSRGCYEQQKENHVQACLLAVWQSAQLDEVSRARRRVSLVQKARARMDERGEKQRGEMTDTTTQARIIYLQNGYDCIPLKPNSKHPLAKSWDSISTSRQWYNAPTDSNVGLRAGNGKAFLDCDDKNQAGTFSTVLNWLDGLGHKADTLPIGQTASGIGRHVYVNFTGSLLGSTRNFNKQIGAGEFRYGNGAQVAAYPSIVDGRQYKLVSGDIARLPVLDIHDIAKLINLNETVQEKRVNPVMSHNAVALANGKGLERFPSRSEAEFSLVLSLINSGFDYSSIKSVFNNFPCFGCYAEKGEKWLYTTYKNALVCHQRESDTRQKIKVIQESAGIAAWQKASDKNVFLAHLDTAYNAGKLVYSVGSRDLALAAKVSHQTATTATKRLIQNELLELETPYIGLLSNVYALKVDKVLHYLKNPCEVVSNFVHPEKDLASHDAFRNGGGRRGKGQARLGQRAGQIYQALTYQSMTVQELHKATGASKKTIKRALKKMNKVIDRATGEIIEMVSRNGDVWCANLVDLNLIAAIHDTYGATGKQREKYADERREHIRTLELGALLKSAKDGKQ